MSNPSKQIRIPAVYMRGGTSKGVFFSPEDLPSDPAERDAILMRVIGSPDPYEKHTDGMGGATSSTSKVVIIGKSAQPDCDVDYLFGQVSITQPMIDWSGNCGNLTSAVGPFAIRKGLVKAPRDGMATVRIWQANIQKRIVAHVPMQDGEVVELGDFELDGVAFPAAEIQLEFLDPGTSGSDGQAGAMLPTGNRTDLLSVPGVGDLEVTYINAGIATVFVTAASIGLTGTERQDQVNNDEKLLARFEAIRAHGAVAMGLAESAEYATAHRQHTPKLTFVGPPADYTTSSGKRVRAKDVDLVARTVSMGKLHHAMTGTGAVAIAAAAAVPDTIVNRQVDGVKAVVCFGHTSGTLKVGAQAEETGTGWTVTKVTMSRSARRLMEGHVLVPSPLK